MTGRRVIVIGGGVIGLSCAWSLARTGHEVTVYDCHDPGRPSDVAAGMLAPTCELDYEETSLLHLSRDSVRRWPDVAGRLQAETGIDVGLRREGTLLLATEPDDRARLERRARLWDQHDLPYAVLDGRACRAIEPALSRRVLAALQVDTDLSVDNRLVLRALERAVGQAEVPVIRERAVLDRVGDAVTGVRTANGAHAADVVVLAGGTWSDVAIDGAAPFLGVRPVKGQQLRLHAPEPLIEHTLRARVDQIDVYLVPRLDGTIVVGGTSEDVGVDLRRTPRAALDLLGAACAVVPELRDTELVEHDVGLRPACHDGRPIVAASPLEGLVVATGHYRHGFLLAPVTAEAVTAAVMHHEVPGCAAPFGTIPPLERIPQ